EGVELEARRELTIESKAEPVRAIDELRKRFDYRHQQRKSTPSPPPPPTRPTPNMRSMGTRVTSSGETQQVSVAGGYAVGQRVSHPRFGEGVIEQIDQLATDSKLVVNFGVNGIKTLLAKFAKLTKL
ncbi:MAG: hypothetical protein SNF60_05800, partial [Rikenellaceae bacterium]